MGLGRSLNPKCAVGVLNGSDSDSFHSETEEGTSSGGLAALRGCLGFRGFGFRGSSRDCRLDIGPIWNPTEKLPLIIQALMLEFRAGLLWYTGFSQTGAITTPDTRGFVKRADPQ